MPSMTVTQKNYTADDPSVVNGVDLRKRVDRLTQLIEHFSSRWKQEYLISLREFYKVSRQGSISNLSELEMW